MLRRLLRAFKITLNFSTYNVNEFKKLPEELIEAIFQYLDLKTLSTCRLICIQWNAISTPICRKRLMNKYPVKFSTKFNFEDDKDNLTETKVLKNYLDVLDSSSNYFIATLTQPAFHLVDNGCLNGPILQTFFDKYGATLKSIFLRTESLFGLEKYLRDILLVQCPNLSEFCIHGKINTEMGFLSEQEKQDILFNTDKNLKKIQTQVNFLPIYLDDGVALREDIILVCPLLRHFYVQEEISDQIISSLIKTKKLLKLKNLTFETFDKNVFNKMAGIKLDKIEIYDCDYFDPSPILFFLQTQSLYLTTINLTLNCDNEKENGKIIQFPDLPRLRNLFITFGEINRNGQEILDSFAPCNFGQKFPSLRLLQLNNFENKFNIAPLFIGCEKITPQLKLQELYFKGMVEITLLRKISEIFPNHVDLIIDVNDTSIYDGLDFRSFGNIEMWL